ncbi:hypothetical protein HYV84_08260 [Candidatus Woesearchaeota archaeon]|nr:hypothetical protein [Candidatus Woesearchaeota archaeon]
MKQILGAMFILGAVIAIPLIVGTGCAAREENTSGQEQTPNTLDSFAKCLSKEGVTLYGASWCPHCQNQKEMFGESWQFVHYVECALPGGRGQAKACADAGIEGYPTWVFGDGTMRAGELTIGELSEKSGCEVGK